jgi:hypothetical protein
LLEINALFMMRAARITEFTKGETGCFVGKP